MLLCFLICQAAKMTHDIHRECCAYQISSVFNLIFPNVREFTFTLNGFKEIQNLKKKKKNRKENKGKTSTEVWKTMGIRAPEETQMIQRQQKEKTLLEHVMCVFVCVVTVYRG